MAKPAFRGGRNQQATQENIELLTGQRGNGLDRALTLRDLAETSLIKIYKTASGNFILDKAQSSQSGKVSVPSRPTGFEAEGAFSAIMLSWDAPSYSGHSHTEVWRGSVETFTDAVCIATTPATVFGDLVSPGSTFFYWVRHVNIKDTPGPYDNALGTKGETSQNISQVINELADQLEQSNLVKLLVGDIDFAQASIEIAKHDLNDKLEVLRDESELADGEARTLIAGLETSVTELDYATASKLETLESSLVEGDNSLLAQISQLEESVVNADSVISKTISHLNAAKKVVSDSDRVTSSAEITKLETVIADAEQALAQQITTLESSLDVQSAQLQTLSQTLTSIDGTEQALAQQITTLEISLDDQSAQLQTLSQTLTSIDENGGAAFEAMWGTKANVNGISAGIGILADSQGNSQVAISASQVFVFDPNTTNSLTPLLAISNGAVTIPKALIENATIQILQAQSIVADSVKAGISIETPTLTSAVINGAEINVGTGGAYGGYHTKITANGVIYTDTLMASGGVLDNVTINESCVVLGTLYAGQIVGDVAKPTVITIETSSSAWISAGVTKYLSVISDLSLGTASWTRKLIIPQGIIFDDTNYAYDSLQILINGSVVYTCDNTVGTTRVATSGGSMGYSFLTMPTEITLDANTEILLSIRKVTSMTSDNPYTATSYLYPQGFVLWTVKA